MDGRCFELPAGRSRSQSCNSTRPRHGRSGRKLILARIDASIGRNERNGRRRSYRRRRRCRCCATHFRRAVRPVRVRQPRSFSPQLETSDFRSTCKQIQVFTLFLTYKLFKTGFKEIAIIQWMSQYSLINPMSQTMNWISPKYRPVDQYRCR